ncbi:MAG: HIT family protein [Cyanobacteria bacterium P01_D01_bin.56]
MANNACLFCRIAAGHLPAHMVYESPNVLAFLDIRPIRPGHVQIIPREHFDYYDTMPLETLTEIASVGQRLAPILRDLFEVKRVAFVFTGGDIPHAHAHVVPMVEATDITSKQYIAEQDITFQDRPRIPDSELSVTAKSLHLMLQG